ncbi:MAG: S9 family peptidase [Anaerolineaceae bacterium]|nr:S9 family peptidase [Anaerolineaceae bacterium]
MNKNSFQKSIMHYFRPSEKTNFKLSPDGLYYSFLCSRNKEVFHIKRFENDQETQIMPLSDGHISEYYWANDHTLIYLMDKDGNEIFDLYRVNIKNNNHDCLTKNITASVKFIALLESKEDEVLIGINQRNPKYFDLHSLHLPSGQLNQLAKNPGEITNWVRGHDGKTILGYDSNTSSLFLPVKNSSKYVRIFSPRNGDTLIPLCFAPLSGQIYAYSNIGRDKFALVLFNFRVGVEESILFENLEYDVFGNDEKDKIYCNPINQEISFINYTTWKQELHIFTPELRKPFERIQNTFKSENISILSNSNDMKQYLLQINSDIDPGRIFHFDLVKNDLNSLHQSAIWLKSANLAEMKAIQYLSRDGMYIHAYLTLPQKKRPEPYPLIVHPHAGPWWRNTWGYDPFVQFLANLGYAVFQPNFRGSTGYGKKVFTAGFKQWGRKMQDDISDGVNFLISEGIANKEKIAIFGWSYGGYAALAGLTFTPKIYKCGIDLWGISNLFTFFEAIPEHWKPQLEMMYQRIGNPELDAELFQEISPVFHAGKIKVPLLIAQGANDPRVRQHESDQIVAALIDQKIPVEYILKQDEGHGFFKVQNRMEVLEKIAEFLERNLQENIMD